MVEVGSMEIVGLFKDMNLFSSLTKLKTELNTVSSHVKSTTTEMLRMSKQTQILSGILGAIGVGGFAALLMSMPRVSTQLEIIRMYLELIAMIMDETLGPAVAWVAEQFGKLYNWFKALSPEAQGLITWLTVIGGALISGLGISALLGKLGLLKDGFVWLLGVLKPVVLWAGRLLSGFVSSAAGPIILTAAIGLLISKLTILLLKKTGLLDWATDIGTKFGGMIKNIKGAETALRGLLSALEMFPTGKISSILLKQEFAQHATGGIASYTGLHHLEAGETVSMKGTESSISASGGDTTINNNYDGATFVLTNGLDIDDFIELTSRKQSQKAAWSGF